MASLQGVRTAMFYGVKDIRIEEATSPSLEPGQVAVRPEFCGICGSDLHFYFEEAMANTLKVQHPLTREALPVPFGHEFAGVVTEVDPSDSLDGSTIGQHLAVGDRVAIMPVISDGYCFACQNGNSNVCDRLGFIGINGQAGGMSDRAILPLKHVVKIPQSITSDIGALIEPLAVAWHAIELLDKSIVTASSAVLILGGGPVGCGVLLCLLARGVCDITISEPVSGRRDFCKELGDVTVCHPDELDQLATSKATERKRGYDAVFDCAGVPTSISTAVKYVRSKGTIVGLALQQTATLPTLVMLMKEIRLDFALAYSLADFEAVIAAIDKGLIKPAALITKRIALKDVVKEGLEALKSAGNTECKILIDLKQ